MKSKKEDYLNKRKFLTYLLVKYTKYSLAYIGKIVNKSHCTILYHRDKIGITYDFDFKLVEIIELYDTMVQQELINNNIQTYKTKLEKELKILAELKAKEHDYNIKLASCEREKKVIQQNIIEICNLLK